MAYGLGYATGYADALADNGIMPTVEILLETDPDTYVDIADDYRQITTFRGRNRELDRFMAGTCQIRLSDLGRDYDPSNTAGPYYGNLKPMRRLKVNAHWAGTAYPIFAGYIDSFEHEYAGPANGDATCTIYATDGFKVLEAATLAASSYAQEVTADGPVAWWRLDEIGGTVAHDQVADVELAATGDVLLGSETLISRDPGAAMETDDFEQGLEGEGTLPVTTGPLTIEAVVRSTVAGGEEVASAITHYAGTGAILTVDPAGGFIVATTPGSAVLTGISGADISGDGLTHHLVGVWNADGTLKIYVDGVDRTVGTPSVAVAAFSSTSGITLIGGKDSYASGITGAVDEVAFYDYALTPARIVAHHEAMSTPWNNDLPGERLGRILDAVDWPEDDRDLDDGTSVLQPAELDMSVLEHAQKVAESDWGLLFMTAAGKLRFIGRAGLFNRPQEATFGDGGGDELGYRSLRPEYTDQLIRNDVTVSRLDGVAQRAEDPASIAEYLRHSYAIDGLFHDSDELSRYAAEFILSEYREPQRRISNLIVTPRSDPDDLYPQVLGRELADQITVIDRPPGGGDPNEQDSAIEGIAHTVTPMWWETAWNVAPSFGASGEPAAVGVWGVTKWGQSRWGF